MHICKKPVMIVRRRQESVHDHHRLLADVHQPVRGAAQQDAGHQGAAAAPHHHEVHVVGLRRRSDHLGGGAGEELRLHLHSGAARLRRQLLQHQLARLVDVLLQIRDVQHHRRLGDDRRRRKDVQQGHGVAQPGRQSEGAARGPLRRIRPVDSHQDPHGAQRSAIRAAAVNTPRTILGAMRGKTVVITGATSGIGLEAAVALAREGARVVLVGRNPGKTAAAVAEVRKRSGSAAVESLLCDFSSQESIRKLAGDLRARCERIDVLVNNAGGVYPRRTLTGDRIESTFAVNHLGYFLLTNLLTDLLVKSAPARIVNVASAAHYRGTLDLDDLGFERGYQLMKAYSRSKLANVLFTRELARRLSGKGVTVNALHPGTVATGMWNAAPLWVRPV